MTYFKSAQVRRLFVTASCLVMTTSLAHAQNEPAPQPVPDAQQLTQRQGPIDTNNHDDEKEIVVTGTLLRNTAPAGAEAISISQQAILATGATSTDQLLATIPQLSSFNNLQTVNAGGTQLTVNRINLRNLPQGIGGSSPTLVLVDGHRIVGAGVQQDYPDPDVIPPALIQRVDVLTDGGSASYGSDAVGGVINFITKDDFDGFDVSARQGFADNYKSTDINFTAGKSWDTGSVYVGYNYSRHDPLSGGDRSYVRQINYTTGLPLGQSCNPGNVVQAGKNYAIVNNNSLVLSNANLCDTSKTTSYYPEETRHSVMAGFRQQLTANLRFDLKAFYSHRDDIAVNGPYGGSATVTSANPNYIPTSPGNTASETVYFNYAPVAGNHRNVTTSLWAYGITPELTWDAGHHWQVKGYYNYGQSQTVANDPGTNSTLLAGAVTSGLINPYNIAASNSGSIAQVLAYDDYGIGKDTLSNAKVVADGPLFRAPGGMAQIAFGGEYIYEKNASLRNSSIAYQAIPAAPLNSASRNVKSGFAEFNLPAIGPDNHVPLVYSLTFAAAERYDSYSDFGGNWAPNLGVTLKPVSWISLRARWNRSFQAPSLVQVGLESSPYIQTAGGAIINAVPLLQNPSVPSNGGALVALYGSGTGLEPERARDYNLGFDISPPITPGLNIHFTYWNINYNGQIAAPPLGSGPFYQVPGFMSSFVMLPTIAQIQSFLSSRGAKAADIANAVAFVNSQGGNAYVVADVRARNLGISKTNGFDFGFDYHHEVSFGSIDASYSGSYTKLAINAADGTNFLPNQSDIDASPYGSVGRVGAHVGHDFFAQLTWNHSAGFVAQPAAALNQTKVGAFDTLDLYFQYNLTQKSLPPIQLSLGVTNFLNTSPPLYNGVLQAGVSSIGGYANGSTIGRLFQLGAGIKF